MRCSRPDPAGRHGIRGALVAALTVAALCLCTAPARPTPVATSTASPATGTAAGAPGCRPASPITPGGSRSFPEVTATAAGVAARGLLMPARPLPLVAGREVVKIVWRVTGRGALRVAVHDPSGAAVPLAWGPEAHGDSTFQAPGEEWGTGLRFTRPGCWTVDLSRAGGTARAWFRVRAP